jgi:hypothetical protein
MKDRRIARRMLRLPSPATVIAAIALIVATAGVATAGRSSASSKPQATAAVTPFITGAHVLDNSLTGADINEATLSTVPAATNASHATSATTATNATSATNATNAASAATAQNARGLAGPLASGQTLRGRWATAGHKENSSDFVDGSSFTFQLPLTATPTTNFISPGGPSTAACPGTVAAPSAAPGQLCVYAQGLFGAAGLALLATRWGVYFFPSGVVAPANYELYGTWAVSAATGASAPAAQTMRSQSSR